MGVYAECVDQMRNKQQNNTMERNSPMMLFAVHYECVRDYELHHNGFYRFLYSITNAICLSFPFLMSLYLIIIY
jgi:hypothetical protein